MWHLTLSNIAERIGAKLEGDAHYPITGIATLTSALPHHLSFLANIKYKHLLDSCRAGAVILHPDQAHLYSGHCLISDNPYVGYAKLSQVFARSPDFSGIDKTAQIDPTALLGTGVNLAAGTIIGPNVTLGNDVSIGPNTVIGAHTNIGEQTSIAANVTLYHRVNIGARCIIHSAAVIGADGFGFAKDGHDWIKIAQLGGVTIGDDVEVGAGTTIDRGALSDTIIGYGVKLDNQIQIGHNVELGDFTAIAACSAIAGSAKLGKHCTIAGACGIAGHITLVDAVHVTAMSIVTNSIANSGVYSSGTPLDKNQKWRRNASRFKQLDQIAKRVKKLEIDMVASKLINIETT
ncbi:MAG: UDP-3-O-(3-hydroxymyristoyl)glucosamine N-acyltransferase [Porticoccaceae bacterium]|nr:UDP-3-O-(3-hydroxymyristoyl)glucosamine N-acyltransferase [Porticoccaceae bacterium]